MSKNKIERAYQKGYEDGKNSIIHCKDCCCYLKGKCARFLQLGDFAPPPDFFCGFGELKKEKETV